MLPLPLFSLPAGVLADRVSKRTVIIAMKVLELCADARGRGRALSSPERVAGRR